MNTNSKRIARNTLFLYIRMLILMAVTLYTSRVVLATLGVVDFGIYNVVGGIIAMLSFLNNAMSNAVQRYLSFEIGKNDENQVHRIFCVALSAHLVIALAVIVVAELLGPWFIQTYLNIPEERIVAAQWVFQCSVISCFFTIMQVPYNAIIIAKEQMSVYAYISIVETILRLCVVFLLTIGNFDRLVLYAFLQLLVCLIIMVIYRQYCLYKYEEAKFQRVKDSNVLKELISFVGWNLFGEFSWAMSGVGVNMIINMFYGPIVNAAKGLSEQVNMAINRFVQNFQVAVNPQLIKLYAADEIENMKILLFRTAKFSYYLLFILSLPIIIEMHFILSLWLEEVPSYTEEFCQLILICSLVSTMSNVLAQIPRAYGKIRNYQLIVSTILLLNFPLSYLILWMGASPLKTSIVAICIQFFLIFVRLYLVRPMVNLSIRLYLSRVVHPCMTVTLVSCIVPLCILSIFDESYLRFFGTCVVSLASSMLVVYYLGMNKMEQCFVVNIIQSKIINKKV